MGCGRDPEGSSAAALVLATGPGLVIAHSFEVGDFVPASRRSQYAASRTNWHDLLSRHCPHFGQNKLVALPLPQPRGFTAVTDSYKVQLSFHGDRLLTSWIRLMGKGAPVVPYVHVTLTRRGAALKAVKAEVAAVPQQYLITHHALITEFSNASHWPKHLLLDFKWRHEEPINADAGLYILFIAGLLVAMMHIVSVMVTYQQKLTAFMNDMMAEGSSTLQPKAD
ncbi:hypothetical protein WJX73_006255 [Symbiochloris irregularis]|uniref:Uncharacterized protein n=1 Tax=Symbiochloris irregularis TaxID=706552 RepID=A0AAW1P412_9CHLO